MKHVTKIKSLVLALAGAGLVTLPNISYANPSGGQVVAGNATIQQESATKIGITQTTNKAIIDWQKFSIGVNEHVQYYQPSASAVTLNRVVGQDPSQILGRLTANGQVFLVNPNGIYFGKDAQIDVAGLVATTHNIRNEDFLAGKYLFNIPGKPDASVINEGQIRIADTGIAAFVAPSVANRGVIAAKLGKVVLASANGFTLDFYGDDLISFVVSDEVAKTAFDINGNQLTSFVENSGKIEAQGGYVLLTAKAAETAIHGVINHSGVIEAQTVAQRNGEIILHAGKGSLEVTGTLDASAPNGGDGGFIETSGGSVAIQASTKITTKSTYGKDGKWLIDPTNYVISSSGGDITGEMLSSYLGYTSVEIQTASQGLEGGDIFVRAPISWQSNNSLSLLAHRNINIYSPIYSQGSGNIKLRADKEGGGSGDVRFFENGHIFANNGNVDIFYNPVSYVDQATKSELSSIRYSSDVSFTGQGSLASYMLINNIYDLQNMNLNINGYYALGRNIDAAQTANWNSGQGFRPVGDWPGFNGVLNGQGYVIDGLYIHRENWWGAGLFSYLQGRVFDIGVTNANIYSTGTSVGILAGRIYQSASIENSYSTGQVHGNNWVGGLVGSNSGSIIDSHSSADVDGVATCSNCSYVGGLAGVNAGQILRSYATGSVRGGNYVGGLVGALSADFIFYTNIYNAIGNITDSYSTGSVSGYNMVGGLVGKSDFSGNSIVNSYSTGSVNSTYSPGGLIGYNTERIENSYWNSSASSSSAGGTPLTQQQLTDQSNFIGFDFLNTWVMNSSTPTLKPRRQSNNPLVLYPGVVFTTQMAQIYSRYVGANSTDIFNGIIAGDLRNDPSDPIWHALYSDGQATPQQIEANRLWNLWDHYRYVSADQIISGVISKNLIYNISDPVWSALLRANSSEMTKAIVYLDSLNNCQPASTCTSSNNSGQSGAGSVGPYNPSNNQSSPIDNQTEALVVKFIFGLPAFDNARLANGTYNLSLLDIEQKKLLVQTLRQNGILLNFSEFGQEGQAMENETRVFNDEWAIKLNGAQQKVVDAGGVDFLGITELTVTAGFNIATAVADSFSLAGGAQLRAAKSMPTVIKLAKAVNWAKHGNTVTNKARKLFDILDSAEFQLLSTMVQNGFVLTQEMRSNISSDESLRTQLTNGNIFLDNQIVGHIVDAEVKGALSNLYVGKLGEALVKFASIANEASISGQDPEIKDVLLKLSEFVPVFGSVMAQYNSATEIVGRQNPEEKAAVAEYVKLQEQYKQESETLLNLTLSQRLQIVLNSANGF